MVADWLVVAAWLYALFVVGWFVLNRRFGDTIWWLALLNPFGALFFLPLPLIVLALGLWPSYELLGALLPPLLIGLWLYGPLFWPRRNPTPPTRGEPFTVMTFNLWWRSQEDTTVRVPLQCGYGSSEGAPAAGTQTGVPDIVAVQELMPHMAARLQRELGADYPHRAFVVGEEMNPPRRLGVLSRYPLTALDAEHLVQKDFRLQIVRVHLPQHTFLLYNIHPRATLIVRYLREEGPLAQKVRKSFAERAVCFQRMLADIAMRREPVVVVGDFNSTDLGDAYALMARQLTDAHRAAGWGFGHTFPMHGADLGHLPLPTRLMRLDMIFYSAGLTALRCRTGRCHGESDHLPVLATFGWSTADGSAHGA